MTVYFQCRTELETTIQESFDLARSIDVHVDSMSRSRERAIGGVTGGLIAEGEEVTWRARHFGIPFRLTSRITEMAIPRSFVDKQVRGPFRSFRHEHTFSEHQGRTTMIDHVEFSAPFGVLGRLAEKLVLARYLRRLIEQRNRFLVTAAQQAPPG
ncbi:SRPBCC family protein [Leifsonia sp. YAF41]|uniref:SRPBCC family protein n=1 Tax=Leifsonia sp. YAF41 TaxID=3233086 RepID=UPI003F98E657